MCMQCPDILTLWSPCGNAGYGESGGLGNGYFLNSNIPVAVSGGLSFRQIDSGTETTCGLLAVSDGIAALASICCQRSVNFTNGLAPAHRHTHLYVDSSIPAAPEPSLQRQHQRP